MFCYSLPSSLQKDEYNLTSKAEVQEVLQQGGNFPGITVHTEQCAAFSVTGSTSFTGLLKREAIYSPKLPSLMNG